MGFLKPGPGFFYLQTIQCKIRVQYALDTLNRREVYTQVRKHGYKNCTSIAHLNSFGLG